MTTCTASKLSQEINSLFFFHGHINKEKKYRLMFPLNVFTVLTVVNCSASPENCRVNLKPKIIATVVTNN